MRFDFISIVVALIGVNFFIFDPLFIPREDARTKLELFYFFYNSYMQSSTWPLWMPLHTFGVSTAIWQWIGLTPVHYAAIIFGKILHITDVPWLFKVCQLANEILFVTGLYTLCRLLWQGRYIPWLLCLGCGLFHCWFMDMDMKFHVFYFLPWVLWLLIRFFQTGKTWMLWLVPVGLIAWMMGNCLYYFFIWGWLLVVFAAVMFTSHRKSLRLDLTSTAARSMLILMLVVLAAFYWQTHLMGTQSFNLQRVNGSRNTLANFMTYSIYQGNWENIINYFVLGTSNLYYLPTALFIFAVWAVCFVRQPIALALMITGGTLMCFSFEGWLTYLSYFLPGMAFFHDAGNVYGLMKVFITLLAGYGIQDFMSTDARQRWARLSFIMLGVIIAIDGLQFTRHYVAAMFTNGKDPLRGLLDFAWGWRLIGLGIVGIMAGMAAKIACLRNAPKVWIKVLLALWVILDLAAYDHSFALDRLQFRWPTAERTYWTTSRQDFVPMRSPEPILDRDRQLWSVFTLEPRYAPVYSVMNDDPCWPYARVDFVPKRLSNLIRMITPQDPRYPDSYAGNQLSLAFERYVPAETIGCQEPKLRFVADPILLTTSQETLSYVKARGFDPQRPVIETSGENFPPNASGRSVSPAIQVMTFDSNSLKVSFNAPQSGWFVYADNWYPGWKAWINGKEAEIYPSDIMFKAVHIPQAGATQVEWRFEPSDGIISICWVILGCAIALGLGTVFIVTLVRSLK